MEKDKGLDKISYYHGFKKQIEETKLQLHRFLKKKKPSIQNKVGCLTKTILILKIKMEII